MLNDLRELIMTKDLSDKNLRGANLYEVDLRGANLFDADLTGANLYAADLRKADLREADCAGANLYLADLCEADLRGADFTGANLSNACLRSANLSGADLVWTNLNLADFRDTCLDPERSPKDATQALVDAGFRIEHGLVYGFRTKHSLHADRITYLPGTYVAPVFSTDENSDCHPGIYFAPEQWLRKTYASEEKLVRIVSRISDVCAAGDKFRTKELMVLPDIDF